MIVSRRIPRSDDGTYDWGKRSMQDDPESSRSWGRETFSTYTPRVLASTAMERLGAEGIVHGLNCCRG